MREKVAMKSSMIGLFSKTITIAFSLIVTKFFVEYIGIETQGINRVYSDLLGFLQLAELGIGTAITYALYQPIVDKNIRQIQALMDLYKKLYRIIFLIIVILGVCLIPLIPVFVTDSTFSRAYLTIIYLIQLATSASTYLLAYKRNLLYADQKQYISTMIDAMANLFGNLCCIAAIVWTRSYCIYLIILFVKTLLSNVIVNAICNRIYPYLKDPVVQKYEKMDELFTNVKDLIIGRIGGWIYNSTDNLIISKFVGIVSVGLLGNYYTIKSTLMTIAGSIVEPIMPLIGNYIREKDDKTRVYQVFMSYSFIRFGIANLVCVGFIVMANPVIEIWLGSKYQLSEFIIILLAADMFISITHGATNDFIQVLGLFKDDRNMSLGGMAINLVTSLVLAWVCGIQGVLIGTVIAQCYYWTIRAKIVFSRYFMQPAWEYVAKIVKYLITTGGEIAILFGLFRLPLFSTNSIIIVIVKCLICAIVSVGISVVTNLRTEEWKIASGMITKYIGMLGARRKH